MEFSPDVLIYVQTIRNYFTTNESAREYFLKNVDHDLFFENLAKISEVNFQKTGDAQLTKEQFEFLRISMMIFKEVSDREETIFDYKTEDIKFHLK
jgi:hypothetical protein